MRYHPAVTTAFMALPRPVAPARPITLALGLAAPMIGWLVAQDWIGGLAALLLWAIWYFLAPVEGPPVHSLALTFQWLQVSLGVYYWGLFHRPLETVTQSNYRVMVLIGLGCVAALWLALIVTLSAERRQPRYETARPLYAVRLQTLLSAYFVLVGAMGFIHAIAWRLPLLTQGILALSFLRLVCLYLLFRRLSAGRIQWAKLAPLLAFEMLLGFTGFFAGFREPLMLFALALFERFEPRRVRHWVAVGLAGVAAFLAGLMWMSIRTPYRSDFQLDGFAENRSERIGRIGSLSKEWLGSNSEELLYDLDSLVDRLWAVYYPALAVARVPEVLPHENGQILWGAIRHIFTPRILFPGKGRLPSDSEMVRKYSGKWVAGEEEGTSIAFGYAAESYVDFGLPLMFLPVFVWGLVLGGIYSKLRHWILHRELAVGLTTVVIWMSLYIFERSWIKNLGFSFTLIIYLGGAVFLIDRFLFAESRRLRGARID